MARPPPPKHTQWKPGQSGNISGRPKHGMTPKRLRELFHLYGSMTPEDLQKATVTATVIERAVIAQLVKAAKGDNGSFAGILDRWIGTAKDGSPDDAADKEADLQEAIKGVPRENLLANLRKTNSAT